MSYINRLREHGPHAQDFQRYAHQEFMLEPEWATRDRNVCISVFEGIMEALYRAPPSTAEDIFVSPTSKIGRLTAKLSLDS